MFPRNHVVQPSRCFLHVVPFFKAGSCFMSCTSFISSWLRAGEVEGAVLATKYYDFDYLNVYLSCVLVGGRRARFIQILTSMLIKGYDAPVWDFEASGYF